VRSQGFQTSGEGIPLGRFVLHPSLTLEFARDDNVFRRNEDLPGDDLIRSGVMVTRARILLDMPLGQSRVRWAYSPVYRDYTSGRFRQSERFSHFFDLDGSFQIGPSLRLAFREHFVRGTVELQEVDPGGELTFGLVPFVTHEPQVEVELSLGARHGVSLLPRYSSIRFERVQEAPIFDSRRRGLEGRYNYRLNEPSTLYAFYQFESTDLEGLAASSSASRSVGIGLRRDVSQVVVTQLSAGYQSIEFEGGTGMTFSGPVITATARLRISDVTSVEAAIGRQPYQSYSIDTNYYVNTNLRLRIIQQIGRSIYWQGEGTLHRNVYVDPETPGLARRREWTGQLEIGAGYQFRPTLRAYVGYTSQARKSNIETVSSGETLSPLDYQANRVSFRIEVGWL
jgi:hypothetical protein